MTQDISIYNDAGAEIDAHFSVERKGEQFVITVESRGGTVGSSNARNTAYADGLLLLLTRLAALRATITDAVVDSSVTRRLHLPHDQRRLNLPEFRYPIHVSQGVDISKLRVELCAAQRPIGRKPGAKGLGNNTKRMSVYFAIPGNPGAAERIALLLSHPANLGVVSDDELKAAATIEELSSLEPQSIADERKRIVAAIVVRQGQPQFRQSVLAAYGGRCAVSACMTEEVLEAAHVIPFLGPASNDVRNGLLLRSDLHVLFDRGMLTIDSATWKVILSSRISDPQYRAFDGQPVRLPANQSHWPRKSAINTHRCATGL